VARVSPPLFTLTEGINGGICATGFPRGSAAGTDESSCHNEIARSSFGDRERTQRRVRGHRKRMFPYKGSHKRLRCLDSALVLDEELCTWDGRVAKVAGD
jgi:hypothetical protein